MILKSQIKGDNMDDKEDKKSNENSKQEDSKKKDSVQIESLGFDIEYLD